MTTTSDPLLKTPLNDLHVSLGARMVPFAGYSMPVQYPHCLLYTSPSPRDGLLSRMPSSA